MALSPDMEKRISPPGPNEMIMDSTDTYMSMIIAGSIARDRKDRETGIDHLTVALSESPGATGDLLKEHGFDFKTGLDALRQLRGRNRLRRTSKEIPAASDYLRNLLARAALNNLVLSGGVGEISSLNLLHTILTSDVRGVAIGSAITSRYRTSPDREVTVVSTAFQNEGKQVLKAAGVDLEKLTKEVGAKTVAQYYPQNPHVVTEDRPVFTPPEKDRYYWSKKQDWVDLVILTDVWRGISSQDRQVYAMKKTVSSNPNSSGDSTEDAARLIGAQDLTKVSLGNLMIGRSEAVTRRVDDIDKNLRKQLVRRGVKSNLNELFFALGEIAEKDLPEEPSVSDPSWKDRYKLGKQTFYTWLTEDATLPFYPPYNR